jgi:hypothetical protein
MDHVVRIRAERQPDGGWDDLVVSKMARANGRIASIDRVVCRRHPSHLADCRILVAASPWSTGDLLGSRYTPPCSTIVK